MYSCTIPIPIAVVIVNAGIFSQDKVPELITDRPDRTESALTVPAGWLQIETGFEFAEEIFDDNSELNEVKLAGTLLRYGITEKFELRLGEFFFRRNSDHFLKI